jgi:hypothetical protein
VRVAAQRLQRKGPAAQIDLQHVVGDDLRAKVRRLLAHQVHQLRPGHRVRVLVQRLQIRIDAVLRHGGADVVVQVPSGETWVVFDLGRQV